MAASVPPPVSPDFYRMHAAHQDVRGVFACPEGGWKTLFCGERVLHLSNNIQESLIKEIYIDEGTQYYPTTITLIYHENDEERLTAYINSTGITPEQLAKTKFITPNQKCLVITAPDISKLFYALQHDNDIPEEIYELMLSAIGQSRMIP